MWSAKQVIESMETRFLAAAAPAGYACRVHIQLRGSDVNAYTVSVADGKCSVAVGHHGTPNATVNADADTYVAVAFGKQRIEWAVLRGRISLSPISTMRTFSKLFKPPQA
jgi:hypothetical protein